ncbi:MAG: hypothetical protein C0404_02220 [Verrucomicrobia bacterium]|nr:hypothetical protein [Verrucomicrobiota bacterium]
MSKIIDTRKLKMPKQGKAELKLPHVVMAVGASIVGVIVLVVALNSFLGRGGIADRPSPSAGPEVAAHSPGGVPAPQAQPPEQAAQPAQALNPGDEQRELDQRVAAVQAQRFERKLRENEARPPEERSALAPDEATVRKLKSGEIVLQ